MPDLSNPGGATPLQELLRLRREVKAAMDQVAEAEPRLDLDLLKLPGANLPLPIPGRHSLEVILQRRTAAVLLLEALEVAEHRYRLTTRPGDPNA